MNSCSYINLFPITSQINYFSGLLDGMHKTGEKEKEVSTRILRALSEK
jgi:hypothetical protein